MTETEKGNGKEPSGMGMENRHVELEGDQQQPVEMHAPFKTHELAFANSDDARVEMESPEAVHELPDTSKFQT